ncbi:MAG TPA: hypothetical protein VGE10_00815 [Zeimonas sp.]
MSTAAMRVLWGRRACAFATAVAAGTAWIVANAQFLSLDGGLTFFLTHHRGRMSASRSLNEAAPCDVSH